MIILANVTDEQKKKRNREIIINGEVFRKIKDYPNYYISDRGSVMSTVGKWKLLQGFRDKDKYTVVKYNGKPKVHSGDKLCVMAFGGR